MGREKGAGSWRGPCREVTGMFLMHLTAATALFRARKTVYLCTIPFKVTINQS